MLRISRKSAGRTKPQKPQKARANTSQFVRYPTVQEEKLFFSNLRKQKLSSIYAQRDYWMCVLLRKTAIRINPLVHLTLGQAKKALFTERFRIGVGRRRPSPPLQRYFGFRLFSSLAW